MERAKTLKTILLIDDDRDDNYIHSRVVARSGGAEQVKVCLDGEEALQYLTGQPTWPELIFLDINMPGMDGWEFLERYGQAEPTRRTQSVLVMLTTSLNPYDQRRAQATGLVSDFLTKPLRQPDLLRLIETHF